MRRKPRPPKESIFAGGMGRHITWVSILLATITLGSYVAAYSAYGMEPFNPTLGLDQYDRDHLVRLVDDELAPDNWDTLSRQERTQILLASETEARGAEEGSEGIIGEAERIPRTVAFTVLALGQIFHVMAIHAGDRVSFFKVWFNHNPLLLGAVLSTFLLQLMVIYVPLLQATFETRPLGGGEFLAATGLASVILFAVEIEKYFRRRDAERKGLPVETTA
jgi:magnesium-transporting ATPase (P-type)